MRAAGPAFALALFAGAALVPAAGAEGETAAPTLEAREASLAAMNKGLEAVGQGAYDRAEGHLRAAIELDRTNHLALHNLGQLSLRTKRWVEAAQSYEAALALAPEAAVYAVGAGRARYELGELDAAVAHLEAALAIEPRLHRAHELLGRIHRDRGEPHRAAEAWTRSCALAPHHGGACNALAELYLAWGFYEEAARVARAAVPVIRDPAQAARAHVVLGRVHERNGERDEAVDAYSQALAKVRDLPEPYLRRGLARAARGDRGDRAEARADLERYLELGAGPAFHRERAIAALRRL